MAHDNETWIKKIVIGGMPLTLQELDETVIGEFDGLVKRVFAIAVIQKTGITPVEPSANDEFSFVWNGTRLSMSQDFDGKLYMDLAMSGNPSISDNPTYELILHGMPLATGPNREIIFYDSGFTADDIEEYGSMMIGGMPHTIGRIVNDWYWIVNPISSENLSTFIDDRNNFEDGYANLNGQRVSPTVQTDDQSNTTRTDGSLTLDSSL